MADPEDLRHPFHHNEQIQKQFQEMQAQIDRLHAVVYSANLGRDYNMGELSPLSCPRRGYFGSYLWIPTILGLMVGCGWNLRELMQDMIESPTVTKMTYTFHEKLSLPPISIYQFNNRPMLHTERLLKAIENESLTEAYLEAIVKGIGIEFFLGENITVPSSEITEAYKQAILRHGSLAEAGLSFQKEYGIACDELFTYCGEAISPPMNCCDIFEFLWGINGLQYALKRNTIDSDAFRSFSVYLRSFPNIKALQKGDFALEPGDYQSYWIGISNGVDQTGLDAHCFEVQSSESVIILLRQKRRNVKVSKDCVDVPPKLRYFRDYSMSNCFYERCTLDKLSLCNISCDVPLLQVLNSDNLSGLPCELDEYNSICWDIIRKNQPECSTNHGCRFPCNNTEVEYSVTKALQSRDPREISLYFQYATTEVQTFEETSRLTLWEYLGLIGSISDLWLGITIYSLYRMLYRCLCKITFFKPYDFGKNNLAAAHSTSAYQQHEMGNISITERGRRIRSSYRYYY